MALSERLKRAIGVALCDIVAKDELVSTIDDFSVAIPPDNSVTTAKIVNANVTKGKLAAGINAPLMTFAAGQFTTVGGGVAEPIAVAGMLGTDTVLVAIMVPGAVPRTLVSAVAAVGQINLTFSGDPAADHKLIYQVLRATA
jgi:hypothetical protein